MLRETAAVWTHVLCAPYNHAPVSYSVTHVSMRSHTRRVHACIAVHVTCTFGRMTDKDRLRANAVKRRRWNGYRNDRQHSMLNLERKKEKKITPRRFLPRRESATFRSAVRHSVPLSYPRPPLLALSKDGNEAILAWCRSRLRREPTQHLCPDKQFVRP